MFERLKVRLYRYWFERAHRIKKWRFPERILMWSLSIIYSVFGVIRYSIGRLFVYSPKRVKVISVGSIFSGGSGKTLFSLFLTSHLRKKGFKVAYLFKPYVRRGKILNLDEYEEVRNILKEGVIFPPSLKEGVKELDREGEFELVVVDDALTHPFIKKTADILTINKEYPDIKGVIPYGPLRVPLFHNQGFRVLKVVEGGCKGVCMKVVPFFVYDLKKREKVSLSYLQQGRWIAFTGTGDPLSFFKLLKNLNCSIVKPFIFPDHHTYSEKDIEEITSVEGFYITTNKDVFRVKRFVDSFPSLFILKVKVEVYGVELIEEYLFTRISK